MRISYRIDNDVDPVEVADVFRKSGLPRPVDDLERITQMVKHANLIVCACDGKRLVGLARAITDFCFCCYVSDLAVDQEYQGKGIGKELMKKVKEALSDQVMIILLSLPGVHSYYPHLDFEKADNAWLIPRKR